jgi:membrane associated rhomboid family serine protease
MFIPLYDDNKLNHIRFQWVTLAIIILNVLLWLLMAGFGEESSFSASVVLGFGFIPSIASGLTELSPELLLCPEWLNYVSYAFVPGGFIHLAGNMVLLWVFSDNVEDAMGHVRFVIFYCVCAAAGAYFHGLLQPESDAPLIGASGAAAGMASAYLLLHPRVRIWMLAFGRIPLPLPSYIMIGLWILFQFYMLITDFDGQVSWGAHVGGILAGAVLVFFMKRKSVKLFQKPRLLDEIPENDEERATLG